METYTDCSHPLTHIYEEADFNNLEAYYTIDHLCRPFSNDLCPLGLKGIKHRHGCCDFLCLEVDTDFLPVHDYCSWFIYNIYCLRILLEIRQRVAI